MTPRRGVLFRDLPEPFHWAFIETGAEREWAEQVELLITTIDGDLRDLRDHVNESIEAITNRIESLTKLVSARYPQYPASEGTRRD